jgi:transposase
MPGMRSYTVEFREAAIGMVVSQGLPVRQAAERLGIPYFTLVEWVRQHRKGRKAPAPRDAPKPGPRTLADAEARVRELEAAVRRLEMEKDILKRAAAYFAREQP